MKPKTTTSPKAKLEDSLNNHVKMRKRWKENDDYSDEAIVRTLREHNAKKM